MLGLIVSLIIIGLIAGAVARLLVPGKQNLSIGMTIVIGIIGSFVGGFLGYLLFHKDAAAGFLQPAGLRTRLHVHADARGMWDGAPTPTPVVTLRVAYRGGRVVTARLRVPLMAGWG